MRRLAAVLALVALPGMAVAQPPAHGTVTGRVTTAGQPVASAPVQLAGTPG